MWLDTFRLWRRRTFFAATAAAAVAGTHVARHGTETARIAAIAIVVAVVACWIASSLSLRRTINDPARLARKLGKAENASVGDRAERAVRLVSSSKTAEDPLAAALAHVHLDRLLASVRPATLVRDGQRRASLGRTAVIGIVAALLFTLAFSPLRFLEGANVLMAHNGRAPLSFDWLKSVSCDLHPPKYLGLEGRSLVWPRSIRVPKGTTVTISARPRYDDRQLILTDGTLEVPFVSDGRGRLTAGWTIADDTVLEVAARFGDVLIVHQDRIEAQSIKDEAPKVTVDGTPKTIHLLDATEIPIRYEITDDHGLTQVDLVLRAGSKESRRVLTKHDGIVPWDRGSTVLQRDDRFLVGAYMPVEATIEARDNDPIDGPKWGRSKPLVLVPPTLGEKESLRYEALRNLRDDLLDLLASRLENAPPNTPDERKALATRELQAHQAFERAVMDASDRQYGGIHVSRRMRSFLAGQLERLAKAAKEACPSASEQSCKEGLTRLADVTGDSALALDVLVQTLSTRDSIAIARKLSDVADEAADGARMIRQPESGGGQEPGRGRVRLDTAMLVLRGGGDSLLRLGGLGGDLGEVVGIGVRNVERCMIREDTHCAELAATHLAMRLRKPYPSFSGGGGSSGAESGGMPGLDDSAAGAAGGQSMDAFDSIGDDVAKLAKEHAQRIDEVRDAVSEAMESVGMDGLQDVAREHAKHLREAVRSLPTHASDTSSAEGAAVQVREQAERMADALDRASLSEADQAANNALKATDEAKVVADRQLDLFGNPSRLGGEIARVREQLEREQSWVREQLERLRQAASQQSRERLQGESRSERDLADRARRIGEQARSGDNPVPKSTMDTLELAEQAMRDAADALNKADGERAMSHQRKAQRLLETASEALKEPKREDANSLEESARDVDDGKGDVSLGSVDIPSADAFRGPEAFRRRVVEGLSGPVDPSLRDAVRRYTEGLLR